ncbi:type VII secretion target [Nocardia rhizosphaerae]|uniref:Type VII secretion target n=1 Tax=Nocardia rhizosphaerae TaxID=1691571 RepID=A0ABV8L0E1_9NOCA
MADDLKVEPDKLDSFAGVLATLATENGQATTYAKQWLEVEDNAGGLFFPTVANTLHQLLSALETNLATLGTITQNSSTELTGAAQMYRTTDYATAAALDKTYSGDEK